MRKTVPIAALTLALGAGLLASSAAEARPGHRVSSGFRHGHSSVVFRGYRPRLHTSFSLSFGVPAYAPRAYVYDPYPYVGYGAYDSYYPYDGYSYDVYPGYYSTYGYDRGYYGGSVYFGRDGRRSHSYNRHDRHRYDGNRWDGNRHDGHRDGRYDGGRDGRYDGRRDGRRHDGRSGQRY